MGRDAALRGGSGSRPLGRRVEPGPEGHALGKEQGTHPRSSACLLLFFAYDNRVVINVRKAKMETTFAIRAANEAIAGMTLGQVCATGTVFLEVACYQCPRRGRYRLTRLIDRRGAGKGLPVLEDELTADCPKRY